MEWKHYRTWFRGSKKKKKAANNTYAFLLEHQGATESIEIHLYQKEIIRVRPDGSFEVNNHGYWTSPVTKDRFRRFLPWNGHANSWRFNAVTHQGAAESAMRVWTLWLSGAGSHPWSNGATYSSSGHRIDLTAYVNELDANEFCSQVSPFAVATIKELMAGRLEHDCASCKDSVLTTADYESHKSESVEWRATWARHVYEEHVKPCRPSMGIMTHAAFASRRPDHVRAVNLLRPHNRVLWKRATTQKQLAEKVERIFAGDTERLGAENPRNYRRTLRWDIEKYLLELFGFELGS